MPTGYTIKVANGTITTLRDYALTCARAMDALITMHDCPDDAPIPYKLEPDIYYYNKIAETEYQLAQIGGLSDTESELFATTEYALANHGFNSRHKDQEIMMDNYQSMIKKVEAWECDAKGLKDFMLEQLRTGLEFDCGNLKDWKPCSPEPKKITGKEWRQKTLNQLAKDLVYYKNEHEKEVIRTDERNLWLKSFWNSLDLTKISNSIGKGKILCPAPSQVICTICGKEAHPIPKFKKGQRVKFNEESLKGKPFNNKKHAGKIFEVYNIDPNPNNYYYLRELNHPYSQAFAIEYELELAGEEIKWADMLFY